MTRLLRRLFAPELAHRPTASDDDKMRAYWAYIRDANPFA